MRSIVFSALLISVAVHAADWPQRPLRLVVPYAAGGSTDVLARMVGQKLTESLGQPVVIDNRTGAGTLIATEIVARAASDGHTLLMATPPLVIADALYRNPPFDALRDFAAVTNVAATSNVLVVHPALPVQSTRELIALAKAAPGRYAYGSSGVGGASHLAVVLFAGTASIDLLHVPYKDRHRKAFARRARAADRGRDRRARVRSQQLERCGGAGVDSARDRRPAGTRDSRSLGIG